jgi:phosphatidylethanolamine/phosphatidyl-N-methylethanolamine N-methyltransferase
MFSTHSSVELDQTVVGEAYARLAGVYDWFFGLALQAGRETAVGLIPPGAEVLEVGVGTGINIPLYDASCPVTGIDLSPQMLDRAFARAAAQAQGQVLLMRMNAAAMTFPDDSFDIVYAPYVVSAVPDPVAVVREMCRVCRPDGRILILNHFLSSHSWLAWLEQRMVPLARHLGFDSALDLGTLFEQTSLRPVDLQRVNLPRLWSLVTCTKDSTR